LVVAVDANGGQAMYWCLLGELRWLFYGRRQAVVCAETRDLHSSAGVTMELLLV